MNEPLIKSGEQLLTVLGWCIWVMSCGMVLWSLFRLKNPKRRAGRIFFCVCTTTGLVVTLLTSFSKFHLLWIWMLRVIPALLFVGLGVPAFWLYHKITKRRPKQKTLRNHPPFGELEWDDDSWRGRIKLPAWAGFQSRGGAYCSRDTKAPSDGSVAVNVTPPEKAKALVPTEAQCRAVQFQMERGEEVVRAILSALLPHHRELKKDWDLGDELMPAITSEDELRKHIGLGQVHVLPHEADGLAYVGFECGCEWDDEHGLGIVVHRARVVAIDGADIAFSWQPEEPEPAKQIT